MEPHSAVPVTMPAHTPHKDDHDVDYAGASSTTTTTTSMAAHPPPPPPPKLPSPAKSGRMGAAADHSGKEARSRGGWGTLPFIIGNEVCERMGSLSVLWNLVPYLSSKYHMTYVRAGYIVNAVSGTCSLTPLVGAFLADSYFGRYKTIIATSWFTLMGLVLLTISASVRDLQPKQCTPSSPELIYKECEQANKWQLLFLMVAFGLIALGSGGLRSCNFTFGADQFEGRTPEGRLARQRFFNWYYFCSCFSLVFGLTVIVYIQSNISWGLGYLILSLFMMISIILFLAGSRFYLYLPIDRSPYQHLIRVPLAAFSRRNLPLPSNVDDLHQFVDQKGQLAHTPQLRCLDKAAVLTEKDRKETMPKEVCTVHEVEECKSVINLLPIWVATIPVATLQAAVGTFTVTQATVMDLYIFGKSSIMLPPASLSVAGIVAFLAAIVVYDLVVVPVVRRLTGNPRGLSLLMRIGVGLVALAGVAGVCGVVEAHRRREALGGHVESVYWLLPQVMGNGVAEMLLAVGQFELFYDQLPPPMRSMSGALFWSASAVGSYVADLLLLLAHRFTTWLPDNINQGSLDHFYYLLSFLILLDLLFFLACAHHYKYVHHPSDLTIPPPPPPPPSSTSPSPPPPPPPPPFHPPSTSPIIFEV